MFLVAGGLSFWIDIPVTRSLMQGGLPGDFTKAIMISEAFAHTFGVAMILLGVWLLDPAGRSRFPVLIASTIGTGPPAHLLKRLVGRSRPAAWDFSGSIGETFIGWAPWRFRGVEALGDASIQSFPSAHTALAVALAWGLAWSYPRGRCYFAVLATLAGLQRIVAGAHYLSDVMFGAALGTLVFALCVDPRLLGRFLLPAASCEESRREPNC